MRNTVHLWRGRTKLRQTVRTNSSNDNLPCPREKGVHVSAGVRSSCRQLATHMCLCSMFQSKTGLCRYTIPYQHPLSMVSMSSNLCTFSVYIFASPAAALLQLMTCCIDLLPIQWLDPWRPSFSLKKKKKKNSFDKHGISRTYIHSLAVILFLRLVNVLRRDPQAN